MIRAATVLDHDRIVEIAKQTKATRDYTHIMFSGALSYEKGWIRVCTTRMHGEEVIVGFTCVRHKVRQPETSLYYIGVDEDWRQKSVGTHLLEDLKKMSPHHRIVLNVTKDNTSARAFYAKHGFVEEGESLGGKGLKLSLNW
jgi:ribosomal protein S18 acetylase RimI-like enzyme